MIMGLIKYMLGYLFLLKKRFTKNLQKNSNNYSKRCDKFLRCWKVKRKKSHDYWIP